jgi:hypothetical protein
MWCGELEHPHFIIPPSVHIGGCLDVLLDPHVDWREHHNITVQLLGSGQLGGPTDEECLWHVEREMGEGWFCLDWIFPATYGSMPKLQCLLKRSKNGALEVALPREISPTASRPCVNLPCGLYQNDAVIILKLNRCELDSHPTKVYKLGTSIQRAAAGTLKTINKCLTEIFPRSEREPWESEPEESGDKVFLRIWHLRGEVTLAADAMWIVMLMRVEMHKLFQGNPVFVGKYAEPGWLREMVDIEAEHYEETRLADALEDLMDSLHALGFSTMFMESGQGQADVTYEGEPFAVYSTSMSANDITRLRKMRIDHFSNRHLASNQDAEFSDTTSQNLDGAYNERFIKLAFQVRTARIRATMSSKMRVRKHRYVSVEEIRNHRLDHIGLDIESCFPLISTPPTPTLVPIPAKGYKMVGRRLGGKQNDIKPQDIRSLRSHRLHHIASPLHSSCQDIEWEITPSSPATVVTPSWVRGSRLTRFMGAPRVVHYSTNQGDVSNHSESKPVGLVRQDISQEELEILMMLREQSAGRNIWTDTVEEVPEHIEQVAPSQNSSISEKRLRHFANSHPYPK